MLSKPKPADDRLVVTTPSARERYAVIGHPVSHSLSPQIHAAFARQTGEPVAYDALDSAPDEFAASVRAFVLAGGRGLNVTVPFKHEAFAFAARHSPRASRAGAVNTLGFDPEGIWGDNTDGVGLTRDLARLEQAGGPALAGARILIVGAGGAVRGILGPLLDSRPAAITIANRSAARARGLCALFPADSSRLSAHALTELSVPEDPYDLVIHATSGPLAGALPDVPAAVLATARLVYDLSYGSASGLASTPFLQHARDTGARHVVDGLGMLIEQAAESFFVWRGVLPDTAPVLELLRSRAPSQ